MSLQTSGASTTLDFRIISKCNSPEAIPVGKLEKVIEANKLQYFELEVVYGDDGKIRCYYLRFRPYHAESTPRKFKKWLRNPTEIPDLVKLPEEYY